MRYRNRHFPRRYRRSPAARPKRRLPVLLLALGIAALLLWAEAGLSSVSPELTEEAARGYVLSCINRAVEEELKAGESSFVDVERTAAGQVASVSARSEELNRLKAGVLRRLEKKLRGKATVFLPIGSMTEIGLFNGRGFPVPVRLQFDGAADLSFDTEFVSAGINQSCHRVTMTVKAGVYSQSRRFETRVDAVTSTVLAETVVVGEVPRMTVTGNSRQGSDIMQKG